MNRKLTAALALAVGTLSACAAQAEDEPRSLYDRLGGLRSITMVVDDFVTHLLANPTISRNPAVSASRKQAPPPYLKFQFAQLVCEMSGGPCIYTGQTMLEAHEPLRISAAEWETMTAELKKSLERFKVPAAEREELLELFGETRDDIVAGLEITDGRR